MKITMAITPEGEKITLLAGEEGDDHDCQLREKGFCGCANAIEGGELEN